jgi:galactokinase
VLPERFMQGIPALREHLKGKNADRAIMRAAHYFAENRRVVDQVTALQNDDLSAFFQLIIESGRSSFCYLQNIFPSADRQELSLALMLGEGKLTGKGAWRVHGGGFAGTTLNFVPQKHLESFVRDMEAVFGENSCNILDIRPVGPACIRLDV